MNVIITWKDVILLQWDGGFPRNTPPEMAPTRWPYLNGIAHWSKKTGKFILALSAGNIERIFKQFGTDNVMYDPRSRPLAETFMRASREFGEMCNQAHLIKTMPYDQLPKYNYKMQPLAEYQHRGVVLLTNIPRVPLFADCGVGKTFMALTSTENHIKAGKIEKGKTLICAKLATLESGWLEDAKKFTDLNLKCLWLPTSTRKRKERLAELLQEDCDAYLINHDGLFVLENELCEKKFQKIIVDESTILKGFHGTHGGIRTGKFGKALLNIAQCAHWRVVMTGTPAPNGPEDLWGQMHFLDPKGNLLERQFNEFRQLYFDCKQFRVQGKVVKKWEPLPDTLDKVNKVLSPLMYRLRIRDHLDLPQLITMKRFIAMDKEQVKHYSDLKNYLSTVIEDERIITPIKVTQLMKLRQVTGGFLIDHKEDAHGLPKNPKIEELDSILEEEIGAREKVVIYCQYQWEIKLIESRYKKFGSVSVFGGNTAENNLANIKKFIEDPNTRIIVLHPRSAAHGVTFTVAHYMIFYSLSYSEEEHYQCVKRIERAGQKSTMVVFYLLCKGSIDGIIYDVLQIKAQDQKSLIDVDKVFIDTWRTHNGTQ